MTSAARATRGSVVYRRKVIAWNLLLGLTVILCVYLTRNLRWDVVWESRTLILRGLFLSLQLATLSIALGMVAAIPLAAARVYEWKGIRWIAIGYVETVRAIPPLMLMLWVFFMLPVVTRQTISPYMAGISSLFLIASAYLAEVVRAGLNSVPSTQIEGGLATGLSSLQVFVHVILPQALRNMLPAIIAQFVSLFKTTSLVYVVGLVDFFRAIIIVNNNNFAPYPLYVTAAAGYFICCYTLSWLIRRIDPGYQLVE